MIEATKSALQAHWKTAEEGKGQWLPQEYGPQWWEPAHERSLHMLLEELDAEFKKAKGSDESEDTELEDVQADLATANDEIEALQQKLEEAEKREEFLKKDKEELRVRLDDALNKSAGVLEHGPIHEKKPRKPRAKKGVVATDGTFPEPVAFIPPPLVMPAVTIVLPPPPPFYKPE